MLICFCFSWILEVFHSFFADFCKSVSTFPTGRQEPRCFRFFWCVYQWFFEMYTFKAATHEERRARHDSGAMRKKNKNKKDTYLKKWWNWSNWRDTGCKRLQVLPESPTWKRPTPRTEKDDASIHRACAYPSVCACIHVQCIYLATYLSPYQQTCRQTWLQNSSGGKPCPAASSWVSSESLILFPEFIAAFRAISKYLAFRAIPKYLFSPTLSSFIAKLLPRANENHMLGVSHDGWICAKRLELESSGGSEWTFLQSQWIFQP